MVASIEHPKTDERGRRWTNEWFETGTRETWDQLLRPYVRDSFSARSVRYLEIGVCEGASMLYALETMEVLSADGIDPWRPIRDLARLRAASAKYEEHARHNLAPFFEETVDLPIPSAFSMRSRARLHARSSYDMIRDGSFAALGEFELAYVDGDHSAARALVDCCACFGSLVRGGVLVIDDLDRRWHLGRPWVYEAARAFLESHEKLYTILYRTETQLAVVKR